MLAQGSVSRLYIQIQHVRKTYTLIEIMPGLVRFAEISIRSKEEEHGENVVDVWIIKGVELLQRL